MMPLAKIECPINLDGMPREELRAFCHTHLGTKGDLGTLAIYARISLMARRARLDGRIEDAVRGEKHCDRIYESLPPAWRW